MTSRAKLSQKDVDAFIAGHPGWSVESGALTKTFDFRHYGAGMGFAVHLAFAAEKRDHHPDILVGYRKVKVSWSTHDEGGITTLDTEMAELTDRLFEA